MAHTDAALQRLRAGDTLAAVRAFLKATYPEKTEGARNLTIKRAGRLMALDVGAAPVAAAVPIVAKALGAVPVAAKAVGGAFPLGAAAIPHIVALPLAVPQAIPKAAAVPFNALGVPPAPAVKAAPPTVRAAPPMAKAVSPEVKAAPPPRRALVPPRTTSRTALLPSTVRQEERRVDEEQDRWGSQWADELNQEQRQNLKRRREAAEAMALRVNARHSVWR